MKLLSRKKALPDEAFSQRLRWPGAGEEPPWDLNAAPFSAADRVTVMTWEDERARLLALETSPADIMAWSIRVESAAMAARLTQTNGKQVTAAQIEQLYGRSPAAWSWLSQQLYAPIHAELRAATRREKLQRRFQLRSEVGELEARIRYLQYGIVETA